MFDTTLPIYPPYPVVAAIVSTPYYLPPAWPARTRSNIEDLGAGRGAAMKTTTRRFVLAPSVSPSVVGGVR